MVDAALNHTDITRGLTIARQSFSFVAVASPIFARPSSSETIWIASAIPLPSDLAQSSQ